jgi:NAD(P)-dependent dehydrogenase (short-subunit alcohol dehydrogenase family)
MSKIVMVAGGTGGIGEEIVKKLVQEGNTVVVPYRNDFKRQQIKSYVLPTKVGALDTVGYDIGTIDGAKSMRSHIINKYGKLDGVVVTISGKLSGKRITDVTIDEWDDVLADFITPHFIVANIFIPLLLKQDHGHFIMLNGGLSQSTHPGIVPVSMMASAQLMLFKGLVIELQHTKLKLHTLMIYSRVSTRHEPPTQKRQVTSVDVGKVVFEILEDTSPLTDEHIIKMEMNP